MNDRREGRGVASWALLGLLFILSACSPARLPDPVPADLVIRNANIWTGEPARPRAAALAVRGDSLLAVGSNAEITALVGPGTTVIDSPAGLVIPGFIDSHVHLMESSFELASVQLRDAATPEEFRDRIEAFARQRPVGEWITGGLWDHQNWGGELPHRAWIDDVTGDNPVSVSRLDGHMLLANSRAMALANISRDTPDITGGEIVRDADGNPTGVFKDNAMQLIQSHIPRSTAAQQDDALAAGMAYLNARGVTSVHDMGYNWRGLDAYRRARDRGALTVRIYASVPLADWQRLAEEVDAHGRGDDWLRIGGLKGFMDGSLGSHTAAFFEDYSDTPGDRGFFLQPPEGMRERILAADAAGLHPVIHAIGDRANSALLDIYQAALARDPHRDRRFRIEHAQHLSPADITRIAALDVIPSMQPYHAIDDGRWADKVIGHERARTTYAFRALLDAGALLIFGSDWSVAPASPTMGIYAAATRQTLDGAHPDGWVPEQIIAAEEALVAYTRSAAHASFEEQRKGTLRAGKLADIVILDRDITRIAPEKLKNTRVLRTIVGGKTVYQRHSDQDVMYE